MDIEKLNDARKQVKLSEGIIKEINKYDNWSEIIKKGKVESAWIGGSLVHLEDNPYTSSIQGICTKEEANELAEIIKGFLLDKLEKKKIKLEENFKNI